MGRSRLPRPPRLPAAAGVALVVAGAVTLASCGGTSQDRPEPEPVALEQVEPGAREDVPSVLRDPLATGLPPAVVDPLSLQSGGPPPDGIPAVDEPRFLRAGEVRFLADDEAVVSVEVGGETRAYPVQVLVWHEIVNDTVGGVPVSVTYCPLCASAVAFDRRAAGRVLDFGVSGLLLHSDLVMYDRQTESLWPQIEGRAVAGALTGTELDLVPAQTVPWARWRAAHPDAWVLSRDTGHDRDYGRNPYPGYDDVSTEPFLFSGETDGRLPAKTHVVGVRDGEQSVAVLTDALARGPVTVTLAGRDVVVWRGPVLSSPLAGEGVADGPDAASTTVVRPVVDGRPLTFSAGPSGSVVDRETGSTWDAFGTAVRGPLSGARLEPVGHVDTFWFSWVAFRPDTRIVGGEGDGA